MDISFCQKRYNTLHFVFSKSYIIQSYTKTYILGMQTLTQLKMTLIKQNIFKLCYVYFFRRMDNNNKKKVSTPFFDNF